MSEKWEWRRTRSTQVVETSLSDFDTEQLLQELIDNMTITEAEALRIMSRGSAFSPAPEGVIGADPDHVELAWIEIQRGRKTEALHHIERALGNQWLGRLS